MKKVEPKIHKLDVISTKGVPLRFVYEMGGTVRYHDRRYPTTPDEQHYHPRNYNEDGQGCGPDLMVDSFTDPGHHGIIGWHEVEAWDIDANTRNLVGAWLSAIKERSA